jgi:DNA invertase Pin-like site-specific DNA recombinase
MTVVHLDPWARLVGPSVIAALATQIAAAPAWGDARLTDNPDSRDAASHRVIHEGRDDPSGLAGVYLNQGVREPGPAVDAAIAEPAGVANAANYARISDDPGSRRRGVNRQLADGRLVAARLGLTIYADYVDNDKSAYRRQERRQDYARLCADVEAGLIRYIIFWRADRLHRTVLPSEAFLDLCIQHHVLLVPHSGLVVDPALPEGQKWFRDQVSASLYESQVQSLRGTRAGADYASKGLLNGGGGDRPYGYQKDRLTICEPEAAILRMCAERADAGESMRSLCLYLNREGIPTVRGGPWKPTVLRNILVKGRTSGLRSYHDEVVAKAVWPRIISPEQRDRIRARLAARQRLHIHPPRAYLLTGGRARCYRCRHGLVARPKQDGRRNYVCAKPPAFSGCGSVAILADYLEAEVIEQILSRLDSPAVWEALQHPEPGDPQADMVEQIARKRAKIEEADALWREDAISREQYLSHTRTLRAEIELLARRVASSNRVIVLRGFEGAAMLRARWQEIGIDRQRGIVDVLIDQVTVTAAIRGRNRFDPRRVDIAWKV